MYSDNPGMEALTNRSRRRVLLCPFRGWQGAEAPRQRSNSLPDLKVLGAQRHSLSNAARASAQRYHSAKLVAEN
jgi:hypothetical protein